MTDSDGTPDPGTAAPEQKYADRVQRSVPGMIAGVMLLAIAGWLIVDAMLTGTGRVPWIALAAAPVFAFPVIAYTLRPAVLYNDRRLRVRNPLRTIDVPWASVEGLRSGYSVEMFAGGKKYQVWAVPVSLRARKRASRAATRAAAGGETTTSRWSISSPSARTTPGAVGARNLRPGQNDPTRAWSDQVVDELQEIAERNAAMPGASGPVTVTWCWWVIAPTLVALTALVALITIT